MLPHLKTMMLLNASDKIAFLFFLMLNSPLHKLIWYVIIDCVFYYAFFPMNMIIFIEKNAFSMKISVDDISAILYILSPASLFIISFRRL